MTTGLSTELEHAYSELMGRMAELGQNSKSAEALSLLEKIEDEAHDIEIIFGKDPDLLKEPKRWLDALRLLRYSLLLKERLTKLYDGFVRAYESLAHKPGPDADEKKLKEEISRLMYEVDENSGEHERLSEKLFSEAAFQISLSADQGQNSGFLYAHIDPKIQPRIFELVSYLIKIAQKFQEEHKVALALERMEKLILGT